MTGVPTRPTQPAVCSCAGEPHRHGTTTMYQTHHCSCGPCRQANAEAAAVRRKAAAYGRPVTVPADAAREHVGRFLEVGYRPWQIGRAARVDWGTVERVAAGKIVRIARSTEARLLALSILDMRQGRVDAVGARRRVQALAFEGWTWAEIADAAGLHHRTVAEIANGQDRVSVKTDQAIRSAFAALWPASVPDTKAARRVRSQARRKGWRSALAWAEIDDPAERGSRTG